MKRFLLAVLLSTPFLAAAQPPGYYDAAVGLTGTPLKNALRDIIHPHIQLTYTPGLWSAYYTTDAKPGSKVWDIYSDRPGSTPAYTYTLGTDQCGSVSPTAEGSCYNREHTWPQSYFNSKYPMQSDLFIVYPTDYYVNNRRGNLMYGEVSSPTTTFTNGGKIGTNTYPGAPSSLCFEPIDSFKGDLARNYFYVATRYSVDTDAIKFLNWDMAYGVNFKPWAVTMLLDWHHRDPVSQKEINRNNAVYALQNNRNPFIDHPEYADCIWGTATCTTGIDEIGGLPTQTFGIANNGTLNISWNNNGNNMATNISILNLNGQLMYQQAVTDAQTLNTSVAVADWAKGIYMIRVARAKNVEVIKVLIN